MISICFVILAAIANALMDKIETEIQFNDSLFRKKNPAFWCKPISAHAVNFLPFTKYRIDCWHLAKSVWIWSTLAAVVFYRVYFNQVVDFLVMGLTYNAVFGLFYHTVFKKGVQK